MEHNLADLPKPTFSLYLNGLRLLTLSMLRMLLTPSNMEVSMFDGVRQTQIVSIVTKTPIFKTDA